jgi:hypothetical protein
MVLYGLIPYTDKIAVEWHHNNFWVFGGPGTHSPTHSLTYSLTHTHSLTYSLTYSLTHSHSLTHSGYFNETNADEVKKAEARIAINTKYKNQYDHIMWMIEADPRVKGKFCDWGR